LSHPTDNLIQKEVSEVITEMNLKLQDSGRVVSNASTMYSTDTTSERIGLVFLYENLFTYSTTGILAAVHNNS